MPVCPLLTLAAPRPRPSKGQRGPNLQACIGERCALYHAGPDGSTGRCGLEAPGAWFPVAK